MKKNGFIVLYLLPSIALGLWLLAEPPFSRVASFDQSLLSLGQITSLVGMVLFAVTLILSARLKIFEKIFNGVNNLYDYHNRLGQLSLILLLFHPFLLLSRYASSWGDAWSFFVIGENWAQNWGIISLFMMVFLIILTLYLRPKYNIWKWTHKLLGLTFFLGGLHAWMIPSDISRFIPLRIYIFCLVGVGLTAFTYRTLLGKFLVPRSRFVVVDMRHLGKDILEVSLKLLKGNFSFRAGQFVFLNFINSKLGLEVHPFSIASGPQEDTIKLGIKALGDYTRNLTALNEGDLALVEGPYGAFSFENVALKEQIWLAAGIGITPFMSMARALPANREYDIDLFYCVRNPAEAVYYQELRQLANDADKGLKLHLFCSEDKGHIDTAYLEGCFGPLTDKVILICTQQLMLVHIREQLMNKGVNPKMIYSEEFNF